MDETAQLIEEQKKNLPPELVEAIESTAWESVVQKIGQENNLITEQAEALEQETMLALYAFESPENLTANIAREVGVSEDAAEKIFSSIWENIMEPIGRKAEEGKSLVPEIAPEIHPAPVLGPQDRGGAGPVKNEGAKTPSRLLSINWISDGPSPAAKKDVEDAARENSRPEEKLVPAPATATKDNVGGFGQDIPKSVPEAPEQKQVERQPSVSTPDYSYPGGTDPYREPIG